VPAPERVVNEEFRSLGQFGLLPATDLATSVAESAILTTSAASRLHGPHQLAKNWSQNRLPVERAQRKKMVVVTFERTQIEIKDCLARGLRQLKRTDAY
jgi:hypothetical protein